MKTLEDIRAMSTEEILAEIKKAERNLLHINIKLEAAQEKDTSKLPKQKKYIAQLNTILTEKNNDN
ncbi:MAG: 50S ribosomal protein L29 [Candidatus Gracilibacteria bacterium]|jgi:ribosomal protein L29|nr:50S ribosomal protein L29 [Candidatus Gracilibacteria bacterium]